MADEPPRAPIPWFQIAVFFIFGFVAGMLTAYFGGP